MRSLCSAPPAPARSPVSVAPNPQLAQHNTTPTIPPQPPTPPHHHATTTTIPSPPPLHPQGFRVSVYEKRQPEQGGLAAPAPSGAAPAGSAAAPVLSSSATLGLRSYNVVLSERAMRALDRARVALPTELAPAYHAAVMHK